jgi:hypothetical protein
MLELRAANAGNEARAELRALAADFPGVLRELDRMPTSEIERRLHVCEQAAGGDEAEPWVAWVARYHELVRDVLSQRRAERESPSSPAVARLRRGRLNDVVLAQLAMEFDVTTACLREALFPPRPRGR